MTPEVPTVMHTKCPSSVMVFGVVSSEGHIMPPYFFPQGLRINADAYIDVLKMVVKPWMDKVASRREYVFQFSQKSKFIWNALYFLIYLYILFVPFLPLYKCPVFVTWSAYLWKMKQICSDTWWVHPMNIDRKRLKRGS